MAVYIVGISLATMRMAKTTAGLSLCHLKQTGGSPTNPDVVISPAGLFCPKDRAACACLPPQPPLSPLLGKRGTSFLNVRGAQVGQGREGNSPEGTGGVKAWEHINVTLCPENATGCCCLAGLNCVLCHRQCT